MSSAHTPRELGYRMPAEWEPHAATWLTWPRPDGISFPGRYEAIPDVYARFIFHLTRDEDVHINVWNDTLGEQIRKVLRHHHVPLDRVHLHPFRGYEPWCRDHGPIFVVRDRGGVRDRAVVDWGYNAWGNKYPPFDLDDEIPQHIAQLRGLPVFHPGIVMEGGSLDVNGRGALLTTEACLLHPNRNPQLNRGQIEQYLRDYLGVSQILWLGDGIAGDDTDGHVDDLARFVSLTTIVTVVEDDPQDENYEVLQGNLNRLRAMKDQEGRPFRIVELPMPRPIEYEGQRLPASYANFYIANRRVVVPTYGDPNDVRALEILQREFPDRKVTGIDSTELIWGLGSFHCISQQEPA
ncbi:MAG TPA: agmatine deiminase family protein [Verrucomicrobiota bacterium]|nr:agmatine deiminase family protein [Verrucomicrobiota bacterium]